MIMSPREIHAEALRQIQEECLIFGNAEEEKKIRQFADLRPMRFPDFIGQPKLVRRLKIGIKAAQKTNTALPHLAFIGEAGMGKTSLAACAANEVGCKALSTVGSALPDMNAVADLVNQVDSGIVFVDEAHDLAKSDMPIVSGLLPLLEDFVLHTVDGSRTVSPFTMVFATTAWGRLDGALRSRMGSPYRFDDYTLEDMCSIAVLHSWKFNIKITSGATKQIAGRSRGNPRDCLNLVRECRNVAVATEQDMINAKACKTAFDYLGIDSSGMGPEERKLLELLSNGSASLTSCASYLGMDKYTFEETVEAFLFRGGYIMKTSRGRILTEKGEMIIRENL